MSLLKKGGGLLVVVGLGVALGMGVLRQIPAMNLQRDHWLNKIAGVHRPMVYGFLPYWLVDKADSDYAKYLTDIGYFAVIVDGDGSLVQANDKKEGEPGWNKLKSDSLAQFRQKNGNITTSLVIQSGIEDSITALISDPTKHAEKLMGEVMPLMKQYGYTDINIDIESFRSGSDQDRENFQRFMAKIREVMDKNKLGTLGIDLPVAAFTKKTVIDPVSIQPYVDYVVLMAYDYHYRGSMTVGPVAPSKGAGEVREIDVEEAVKTALKSFRSEQLILGNPLYGYEWETISDTTEAPIIPGSGLTASQQRVDELLKTCTNCSITTDPVSGERRILFPDNTYGSIHQIYLPDDESLVQKIKMAEELKLGGVAFWALGYESSDALSPLRNYKQTYWKD